MKIVQVTYTTSPAYAAQNTLHIKTVMNDLLQLNHPGIFYHTCLGANGKTFIHTAFFQSEADHQLLTGLPSFIHFQQQLKASAPEIAPQQEILTLAGSSKNIF